MRTIKQLLITVAMLLCSVVANAYDFEVNGIYYNIISTSDLTVEVTKGDNKYSGEVIIPETIAYKSKVLIVTSIGGYAFENCTGLTSVVIPNSVRSIGYDAFWKCRGLTSVEIPSSVTSIGNSAFKDCTSLKNISIGKSVISIGVGAFSGCSKLKSIIIPRCVTTIGASVFNGCYNLNELIIEDGESNLTISYNYNGVVKAGLFSDCNNIKTVYLGRNLDYNFEVPPPFENIKSLKSLTIGKNVKSLSNFWDGHFYGCSGLTSIYLLGTNPPNGDKNFTNSHYINTTIYVPQGSLSVYQSADVWKNFWDIQEFDATGIEGVNANDIAIEVTANGITLSDADGKTVAIYSANGTRVANIDSYVGEEITLDRGVYIVRVGSKTMKVKL